MKQNKNHFSIFFLAQENFIPEILKSTQKHQDVEEKLFRYSEVS